MEYNITTFDHEHGTFTVLYVDDVYINFPAPRLNGEYCTGVDLENYIQWRHPSVWKDHITDIEPLLEEDNPDTVLPDIIVQKAALYQQIIISNS